MKIVIETTETSIDVRCDDEIDTIEALGMLEYAKLAIWQNRNDGEDEKDAQRPDNRST